jgi:hypothetical protein
LEKKGNKRNENEALILMAIAFAALAKPAAGHHQHISQFFGKEYHWQQLSKTIGT